MQKVLIFSHEWPPYLGGVGTVGYQLADWYNKNNYQVDVITRKSNNLKAIDGVRFFSVKTMPYFWFMNYRRFFKDNINLNDYDIIILNECAPVISSVGIFSDADYAKTLLLVHGLEIENIYSHRMKNWLRKLFLFSVKHRYACDKSRKLVFVGDFMRQKFLSCVSDGYTNKSEVLYMGVDPNTFYLKDRSEDDNLINIVSSSRIIEMKGYPELSEVMEKVLLKYNNVRWHVCGDGEYLFELKNKVLSSSISKNVIFHGSCSRDKLNDIYSKCSIYILLSRYDEALPLSYIEAQMSGLFSIGYNKGGVVETISNDTGVLINDINDLYCFFESINNGEVKLPDRKTISNIATDKFDMNKTLMRIKDI